MLTPDPDFPGVSWGRTSRGGWLYTFDESLSEEEQAGIHYGIAQRASERGERGVCRYCGRTLTGLRQEGMDLYAEPCGCRLGPGRLVDGQGRRVQRITYRKDDACTT